MDTGTRHRTSHWKLMLLIFSICDLRAHRKEKYPKYLRMFNAYIDNNLNVHTHFTFKNTIIDATNLK